jgi:excisionase family DNA binding protein
LLCFCGWRFSAHLAANARKDAGAVAGTGPANDGEAHMDQLLYTISQCCRMAAIGRTKFYQLVGSGEIPIRKVGKKTLVAATDLKRWAEQLPEIKTKGGNTGAT